MISDISKSVEACAAHYGEQADAMRDYLIRGQARALEVNPRGPLKFDDDGNLDADIRAAYSEHGYYIFENLISAAELAELKQDIATMRARFAVSPEQQVDAQGNPALGADCKAPSVQWVKPLSDPLGGTELYNGRHQVKLFEPQASDDAPAYSPLVLMGQLQHSEACLRLYGHPQLLKVAEAINGEDFAPFNEVIFFKDPGLGAAVSWHQDGDTHWDSPAFDEDIHGFNFMAQLYDTTPVNGVWVVPGSHRQGKIDIKAKMAEQGSERFADAVPMLCRPGDVIICNRQIVHGSFANTGFEPRLTVNFGFHRRSSVLDVHGAGMHSEAVVYDAEHIRKRSLPIGLAIEARRQHFKDEQPYQYRPLANESIKWEPGSLAQLKDYNLLDLSI
ncbi:MAG: phytanoyl-CoA dioxygenase [Gammaproteobacteria bacterium]|nr:phytanoyl-CoA dioxygenase [Gammaproteobacteria bacterium]